jgi:hypothetical protein
MVERGAMPRRSWSTRKQRTGQAAKMIGLGTCCREGKPRNSVKIVVQQNSDLLDREASAPISPNVRAENAHRHDRKPPYLISKNEQRRSPARRRDGCG